MHECLHRENQYCRQFRWLIMHYEMSICGPAKNQLQLISLPLSEEKGNKIGLCSLDRLCHYNWPRRMAVLLWCGLCGRVSVRWVG